MCVRDGDEDVLSLWYHQYDARQRGIAAYALGTESIYVNCAVDAPVCKAIILLLLEV